VDSFEGRVVVITGAGSGLGAALAAGFGQEGAVVVAVDIDGEAARQTASKIGNGSRSFATDVADADAVARLADDVFDHFSRVDVLINNAGVFQGGLMWERSPADFRWTFDVNVFGIVNAVRSFVPRMLAAHSDGHIVNTASVAAFVAGAASSPYVASKSAAFSLTECLAHDLRTVGSSIGVSVLTPSAFDTGIAATASVRPTHYGVDDSVDGKATADALAAMTAGGLSPSAVVPHVLDGIRQRRFLIATRPSYESQLENRFEALRACRLPEYTLVD
jgi:NAD(P)-dependent dehydrogenase (short-subunit alcohol dehydrogenase family)